MIDPNTGAISISSYNVTADTDIAFYVNSVISGITNPIQKVINLKILNWLAQYCQRCTNSDAQKWDLWDSGYSLSSYSWILNVSTPATSNSSKSDNEKDKISGFSNVAKAVTQLSMIVTSLMIIVSSWTFPSSFSSLWLSAHQMQIFFNSIWICSTILIIYKGTIYSLNSIRVKNV